MASISASPQAKRSAPLRLPLEAYICRAYLRNGVCPFDRDQSAEGGAAPSCHSLSSNDDGDQQHFVALLEQDCISTMTSPPPTSSSSSDDGSTSLPPRVPQSSASALQPQSGCSKWPTSSSIPQECKFLHISADHVKGSLRRLVQEGRGFVVCCKDYQCKPDGCRRGIGKQTANPVGPPAPMCKFLHLSSAEEAEWVVQMSPEAKLLREAYMLKLSSSTNTAGVHDDHDGGANTAHHLAPRIVQMDPTQPRIVVGGSASLQLCRQHLRGQCFRGAECRYRHVAPSDSRRPNASQVSVTAAPATDGERESLEALLKELRH